MAEPEVFDDAHREPALERPVHGIVMADRRHTRQQILQAADPHALVERFRPGHGQRWIATEARLEIRDPLAGVLIAIAPLQARLRVELQVIVRVDQPRKHIAAVEIDNRVAFVGRDVDAVDAARA
jgi:hypothetical protein